MPPLQKFDDELRIKVTSEFKKKLTEMANRRGETPSELCRRFLERGLSEESAVDGLDVLLPAIRKAVRDSMKPAEDRLAAIMAKDSIMSGTAMYLLVLLLDQMGNDAKLLYEEARKKAVAYLKSKTEE